MSKYLDEIGTQELIDEIKRRSTESTFIGTQAEWAALSDGDKALYRIVNITDDYDYNSDVVDSIIDGEPRAVSSNAVFDSLGFIRRITASSVAIQGNGVFTPICNFSEFTGNYIGILFGFSTARTPIDFPKGMFNTSTDKTSRFYININDQCNGVLWLKKNADEELEAMFSNQGTATSGFVVWAYTHN